MNRSRTLIFLASTLFALGAQAAPAHSPSVEHYQYGNHLDIAKVIKTSAVPNVCQVVPAKMTYEDHKGEQHVLEYLVMGNGCSNG